MAATPLTTLNSSKLTGAPTSACTFAARVLNSSLRLPRQCGLHRRQRVAVEVELVHSSSEKGQAHTMPHGVGAHAWQCDVNAEQRKKT